MANDQDNQVFALMSRLHVILRRQSGRVTDVEYMRINPGYCRHVLDIAREHPSEDARSIGDKLWGIYFGEDVLPDEAVSMSAGGLQGMSANAHSGAYAVKEKAYVGRLR